MVTDRKWHAECNEIIHQEDFKCDAGRLPRRESEPWPKNERALGRRVWGAEGSDLCWCEAPEEGDNIGHLGASLHRLVKSTKWIILNFFWFIKDMCPNLFSRRGNIGIFPQILSVAMAWSETTALDIFVNKMIQRKMCGPSLPGRTLSRRQYRAPVLPWLCYLPNDTEGRCLDPQTLCNDSIFPLPPDKCQPAHQEPQTVSQR